MGLASAAEGCCIVEESGVFEEVVIGKACTTNREPSVRLWQ